MYHLGVETIGEMYKVKREKYLLKNPEEIQLKEVLENQAPHRLIISKGSFWNMIKNDIVFIFFIAYSVYLPLVVSFDIIL
jgi:hypothetical protein